MEASFFVGICAIRPLNVPVSSRFIITSQAGTVNRTSPRRTVGSFLPENRIPPKLLGIQRLSEQPHSSAE